MPYDANPQIRKTHIPIGRGMAMFKAVSDV